MKISIISYFFVLQLIIVNVVNLAIAQSLTQDVFKCGVGDYPPNSQWEKNFKLALDELINDGPSAHRNFVYKTAGINAEQVYTAAFCPAYVKIDACKDCLKKLVTELDKNCIRKKQVIAWSLKCMIRKSNNHMFGKLDDWSYMPLSLPAKAAKVDEFDSTWKKLADTLTPQAVSESRNKSQGKKFASGNEKYGSQTLYMAVECVGDIQAPLCTTCLSHKVKEMKSCCSGKTTASLVSGNCYIKHALENFLN
ncbi:putative gnk2-like domain-containing protein [Tanacetum coccineum]